MLTWVLLGWGFSCWGGRVGGEPTIIREFWLGFMFEDGGLDSYIRSWDCLGWELEVCWENDPVGGGGDSDC